MGFMNTDQRFRSYGRVTAVGLRAAFGRSCHRFCVLIVLIVCIRFISVFFYNERRTPL